MEEVKSSVSASYTKLIRSHAGVGTYNWETHEEHSCGVKLDFTSLEPESRTLLAVELVSHRFMPHGLRRHHRK